MRNYDRVDLDLLRVLVAQPRASVVTLAEKLGVARNTVHAHLSKLESPGYLFGLDRRVDPALLGHPLTAFMSVQVTQRQLRHSVEALARIPEVIQATGMSGAADLLVVVACRDVDHLFRVDAEILDIDGVERTETSISMGDLIPYRTLPLIDRVRREM